MPSPTAFEVVSEDVQAAALSLGHEVDMDAADELFARLTMDDLLSAQEAALRGVTMEDQSDLAVTRIAEMLQEKGLLSPATVSSPH